jgi:hypothetical protein
MPQKTNFMRKIFAMRHYPVLFRHFPTPFLLMILLAAGFTACSPARQLTAPAVTLSLPDSLPALPQSEIDVPVKVAGKPLLAAADSIVPKEFLSTGWPAYLQPSCDFRYRYRFVRSGFTLHCTNNHISVAMQCSYQVAGGRCICAAGMPVSPWISGYCGFDKEPLRRVDIGISTQFSFLPDYHIRTTSGLDQLTALDRCTMSIFNKDMTQQIVDSIRSSLTGLCKTLDVSAAGMDVAKYLHQTANRAFQKTPIGPYGFLVINPITIRVGTLNYIRDTFTVSLGISCRPELSSEGKGAGAQPPLPPLRSGGNRSGVTLYLPANYEYSFLTRLLNDSLRDKSFLYKDRQVVIKDVAIKGIGHHQLELKIDFAGSYEGRIYLRGTPVLDTAKQALSVPDISYSLESKDLVLKMARALLRGKIRRTVQGNSFLDLAALLKTNLPSLNAQLNRAITPNLYTTGQIRQFRLIGLLAGERTIQAQLMIQADLAVTSTGVPK